MRGKNKKEKLAGIFNSFQKTGPWSLAYIVNHVVLLLGDELLLSNTQKDVDEFFEHEKVLLHSSQNNGITFLAPGQVYLIEYNQQMKDACIKSDKMTSTHKVVDLENKKRKNFVSKS